MIDHVSSQNKPQFKKVEILSSMFSNNHNVLKLEINYMKRTGKTTNAWTLNSMLLNNSSVGLLKNSSAGLLKKSKGKNILGNKVETESQWWNLWDAAKVVLRGTFLAIQAYLQNEEASQKR